MRSRYTAFAIRAAEYVLKTWHPSTRPGSLDLDDGLEWIGLTVLAHTRGGPFEGDGTVEFVARFRDRGERGRLHEVSRFVREDGRWYYVDGVVE